MLFRSLIVDVDAHHYENEHYDEFLPFMENDVFRQLVMSGRSKKQQPGIVPIPTGYQDMGGRVTRYPMRSTEKTDDGKLDVLPADALQALIAAACRLYAARREAGEQLPPVARNSLTATDVMVTASGLLRAADLAAFELGMWQGWTGR